MAKPNITFEDFNTMELCVGEIKSVDDHPNATKLYVMQVDIGNGQTRQIVAGIKPWNTKEELLGKKVVLIINIEPAILRGVESQGMILAASTPDRSLVTVLCPAKDLPPGSPIS